MPKYPCECVCASVCGVGQLYVIGNIHKLCQIFWARFIDQYAKMAATVALLSLSLGADIAKFLQPI